MIRIIYDFYFNIQFVLFVLIKNDQEKKIAYNMFFTYKYPTYLYM